MPLRIYKLLPGEQVSYDLRPVSVPNGQVATPLVVRVERPREGLSVELEITLAEPGGVGLTSSRVPIERGYMAVVQELQRELGRTGLWSPGLEFELVARHQAPPTGLGGFAAT